MMGLQNNTLDLYNLCYIPLLICNKDPWSGDFDGRKRKVMGGRDIAKLLARKLSQVESLFP